MYTGEIYSCSSTSLVGMYKIHKVIFFKEINQAWSKLWVIYPKFCVGSLLTVFLQFNDCHEEGSSRDPTEDDRMSKTFSDYLSFRIIFYIFVTLF